MIPDSPSPLKAAVFLDRDNTLTHDTGYTYKLQNFAWKAGALEGLRCFADAGLLLFIITNQGGIGRGLFREADMRVFNDKLCSVEAGTRAGCHSYLIDNEQRLDEVASRLLKMLGMLG